MVEGAQQTLIQTRALRCACCDGDAGRWQQWHHQDWGVGICGQCADRKQDRSKPVPMMPAEFRHSYGVAGVHYPARYHEYKGKRMVVLATFPVDALGQQMAHEYQDEFGGIDALITVDEQLMLLAYPGDDEQE